MKRGVILLCVLILLVSLVNADIFLKDTVHESDTAVYKVGEEGYFLKVVIIDSVKKAVMFELNGEKSRVMKERDEHKFDDGSTIFVKFIFGDRDGKDQVEYYFAGSGENLIPIKEDVIISEVDDTVYEEDKCNKHCDDRDPCSDDICVSNRCVYNSREGCGHGNTCVKVGQVLGDLYCDGETMQLLKEEGQACSEFYECKNKDCDEVCGGREELPTQKAGEEKGIFSRFFGWIAGLFS